jgi:hypothetical protein
MRRAALPVLAFFVWIAPAQAVPTITVQATPTLGAAPLDVTLTASGDAVAYHWDALRRTGPLSSTATAPAGSPQP